jgi:hypothetical protein
VGVAVANDLKIDVVGVPAAGEHGVQLLSGFLPTRSQASIKNAGSVTRLNRSANTRLGSSLAHWCSLVWIFSTRCPAAHNSSAEIGSSIFTVAS